MKTSYHRKSNDGWRQMVPVLTVVLVCIFLFLISNFLPNFTRAIANGIAAPVWAARNAVYNTLAEVLIGFKSKSSLMHENAELKSQITAQRSSVLTLESLKRENSVLRGLFGRENIAHGILAEVLVKPPQSAYDTVIIDIGKNNGVTAGYLVITPPQNIIGKVLEVNPNTSIVELFSTSGNKLNAIIDGAGVSVTLTGIGGGNLQTELPREISILTGDIVVLPGSPKRVVGTVENIELDATDALQTILVKSPINLSELRFMKVVSPDVTQ